jgi:hypothetical protein
MAESSIGTKLMQSSKITRIGCFGLILVLILLCLIGTLAARHEINRKRSVAIAAYERMAEQVEKAPGVLNRMLAYDCGTDAEDAVREVEVLVQNLPGSDNPSIGTLIETWDSIEGAWSIVNRGCARNISEPAFRDLTVEMEGLRNRLSVEKGSFEEAAQVYDFSLISFPANIVATDFKKLGQ